MIRTTSVFIIVLTVILNSVECIVNRTANVITSKSISDTREARCKFFHMFSKLFTNGEIIALVRVAAIHKFYLKILVTLLPTNMVATSCISGLGSCVSFFFFFCVIAIKRLYNFF